jgi:hypothetical protein
MGTTGGTNLEINTSNPSIIRDPSQDEVGKKSESKEVVE